MDGAETDHSDDAASTSPRAEAAPHESEERFDSSREGDPRPSSAELKPSAAAERTEESPRRANGNASEPAADPGEANHQADAEEPADDSCHQADEQQQKQAKNQPADELGEMPRAIVRRIVKAKLSRMHGVKRPREGEGEGDKVEKGDKGDKGDKGAGEGWRDIQVSKDALVAFSESAKIFVHFITALAHDWSLQAKRQTITAEDVLRGLEDAQFFDFVGPLHEVLEEMRAAKKSKKTQKPEAVAAAPAAEHEAENVEGTAAATETAPET